MFDRLSKIPNETETFLKAKTRTTTKTESVTNSTGQNKSPPHKKRMFNDKDYSEMMKEIMVFEEGDQLGDFLYDVNEAVNDDQADVIELEEHFAMNYWHNSVENMRLEEDDEINRVLDERVLSSEEQVSWPLLIVSTIHQSYITSYVFFLHSRISNQTLKDFILMKLLQFLPTLAVLIDCDHPSCLLPCNNLIVVLFPL